MINKQNAGMLQRKKPQETRTPEQVLLANHDRQAATASSDPVQLVETVKNKQQLTATPDVGGSEPDTYRALLDKIVNRPEFTYDHTQDPSWQAYAKAYRREGDRAAEDALAAASAATGGVPSSYAVTAASQAGDYYASQLADKIPELEQNAYQRYLQEMDLDYQALGALQTEQSFDYNRYLQEQEQKQQEYSNALALYQVLGYMTPEIAEILGIGQAADPPGTGAGQRPSAGQTGTGYTPSPGLTENPGDEGEGELQEAVLAELRDKFPDGYITDQETWQELVQFYGEDALAAANYSYREPGLTATVVEELLDKYEGFKISDLKEWKKLVDKYGEDALIQHQFFFGADFAGTTRKDALAYLEEMGVSDAVAAETLDAGTWQRMKDSNAPDGYVRGNDTYEDYLWTWVTDLVLKYGKK